MQFLRDRKLLAIGFMCFIALIAVLDRPQSDLIKVPQEPLIDLQALMAANLQAGEELGRRP